MVLSIENQCTELTAALSPAKVVAMQTIAAPKYKRTNLHFQRKKRYYANRITPRE